MTDSNISNSWAYFLLKKYFCFVNESSVNLPKSGAIGSHLFVTRLAKLIPA
jgi:hypothetical protein